MFCKIYCQDNVIGMRKYIKDRSIDLVVTSPPYDNLRKYKGFSWNFEDTAKELLRVIKPGGVVIWVVGDATIKGSETGTSFRQALYFKEIGFNLYDTMIYAKQTYVPLTHRRYEQSFEYMFVLSNGKPNTWNPIMIPCKTAGNTKNYNFSKAKEAHKSQETSYATRYRNDKTITKDTKQHPNIFFYAGGNNMKTIHNAPFPYQLAVDQVITWSNPNDVILDPFMGSGTTAEAALRNNRNVIGFELSMDYCEVIRERINKLK